MVGSFELSKFAGGVLNSPRKQTYSSDVIITFGVFNGANYTYLSPN
jgi:hypothetical protein